METKQNNKQLNDTSSLPFILRWIGKNLNIEETKLLRIIQLITKTRLEFRSNFKPVKFFLLCFPFCFGLVYTVFQKYNTPDLLKSFIEKNLPIFAKTSETIDFFTLKLLLDSQSNTRSIAFFSSLTDTYRCYLHESFLLLNKNIFLRFFGQQYFSGTISNFSSASEATLFQQNKKVYKINSFLPKKTLSVRDLDELPSYLENLFQPLKVPQFQEDFFSRDVFNFLETNSVLTKKNLDLNLKHSSELFNRNEDKKFHKFEPSSISCLKINPCARKSSDFLSIKGTDKGPTPSTLNIFQQVQSEYYLNSFFIQNELKNIFLEKMIFPDSFSIAEPSSFVFEDLENEIESASLSEISSSFFEDFENNLGDNINETGRKPNHRGDRGRNYQENGNSGEEEKESSDLLVLEKIISYIDNNFILKDFFSFRKMSGYRYPDLSDIDLYVLWRLNPSFYHHKDEPLRIRFPSFTLSRTPYEFYLENFPSFYISQKNQKLLDLKKPENSYDGPGLVVENSDWRTKASFNQTEDLSTFDSWYNLYLSSQNPFFQTTNVQHSFGVSKYRRYWDEQDKWVNCPTLLKYVEKQQNFSNVNVSYHVPSLDPDEWKKIYFDTKIKLPFLTLPIVETQIPKVKIHDGRVGVASSWISNSVFVSKRIGEVDFVEYFSPIFDIGRSGIFDYDLSVFAIFNEFEGTLFQDFDQSLSSKLRNSQKNRPTVFEKIFTFNWDLPSLENNDFSLFILGSRNRKSIIWKKSISYITGHWQLIPFQFEVVTLASQISFAVLFFFLGRAIYATYGKELLLYFLDLIATIGFVPPDIKEEFEILMGRRETGYRVVPQSKKTFRDLVGLDHVIGQLYDIIWFLRNSGRNFPLISNLSQGVLLVGPPGTGKTLLAQAIAGEARVPLIILSGSSLIEPGESPTLKLKLVFREARKLAPCIVFIDEIDTLGKKRSSILPHMREQEDEGTYSKLKLSLETTPIDVDFDAPSKEASWDDKKPIKTYGDAQNIVATREQAKIFQGRLLMQLLVELDGARGRRGVVVFGATNRPSVLDPALLRPGRLNKIIPVPLPNHDTRIEILKFYGQNLSSTSIISWDYLAGRTYGFSAADLAAIINTSSIRAVLKETLSHTIPTIEHGIDRLTAMKIEKWKITDSDYSNLGYPEDIQSKLKGRTQGKLIHLAYYEAGKTLLSFLLEHHPNRVSAHLWPRKLTQRQIHITENLHRYFFTRARRFEVEHRLIGCYGGKAAEFLFLQLFLPQSQTEQSKKNFVHNITSVGLEDIYFGYRLSVLLVQKWMYYSKKAILLSSLPIPEHFDIYKYSKYVYQRFERLEYFKGLTENLELLKPEVLLYNRQEEIEAERKKAIKKGERLPYITEEVFWIGWWASDIGIDLIHMRDADWYRVFLPKHEHNLIENEEWVFPDGYYNNNRNHSVYSVFQEKQEPENETQVIEPKPESQTLPIKAEPEAKPFEEKVFDQKAGFFKNYTSNSSWNELPLITREYQVQSLVVQSLNFAFSLLDEHRELIDLLAFELISKEILRDYEISEIIGDFTLPVKSKKITQEPPFLNKTAQPNLETIEKTKSTDKVCEENTSTNKESSTIKYIRPSWGFASRQPLPCWVDLNHLIKKDEAKPEETSI